MDIAKLKEQLRRDEGEKLKPYTDTVGKLTIGVGRNLSDVGISEAESDFLLTNDIRALQARLNVEISWWITLTDNRQLVIANMCFNLGVAGLMQFRQFLDAARDGNYATAAAEMLDSKWAKQVGDRAQRLAILMEKG